MDQTATELLWYGKRRNGPLPEVLALFDHLVGACQHGLGNGEAKRLRGLEVDNQFLLDWCLDRQVGRLLALEDAINVTGRASKLVDPIRSVGDQSATDDDEAVAIDRRDLVPGR